MMESSGFMPLGKAEEWSRDTATCHLSRCVVDGKSLLKKSLLPQFLADTRLRTCLRKEFDTGCLLRNQCQYVVAYHRFIDTPTECAIIMDFVDGETLDVFIQQHPLYFRDASYLDALMRQLLEALQTIHHAQVVHLDIKPTNLLLTTVNAELRIIDFGLSYISTYPHTEGLTASFAAPEQMTGGDVDCRTDLFALGKILEYVESSMRKGGYGNYRLPSVWQKVKTKCLAQKKENRWRDVEEIQNFLHMEHRKDEERRRNHKLLRVISFGILLLLAMVVSMVALFGKSRLARFSDEYGNCYQVKSEDSLTCVLTGRADTCTTNNLYIEPTILYDGKKYQVVAIADSAFLRDKRIQTMSLPRTLREIGSRAFRECDNLLVADIPDDVRNMGFMAFWGCSRLSEVHIPKGLDRIPSSCFSKTALAKVEIPEGVRSIGYDAFGICNRLREVRLPQSLKSLERGVFWRCSSLRRIHIPSGVQEIGQFCLMECDSLRDVYNDAQVPQRVVKLFGQKTSAHVVLHVPSSSVNDYKAAECWGEVRQVVAR